MRSKILSVIILAVTILYFLPGCSANDDIEDIEDVGELSDSEAVSYDRDSLSIEYTGSDSASAVTTDITLKTEGENGTTITWSSSDPSVISIGGSVTRPANEDGDKVVTLTATITKGSESVTKVFTLTVIKQPAGDTDAVTEDKANLSIIYGAGDSAGNVTQNVTLPTSGSNGTAISWSSSNTSYIANNGSVTRPLYAEGNQTVTLTATITKGGESDTRNFTFTVKHLPSLTPDGEDSVSPDTNIVIVFPDSFDGTTKGTATFASPAVAFTDGVNAAITFSTTNKTNDTITINPNEDLQSTNYTGISITGFKKSDNSDVTWSDSAYYFPVRGAMDLYFPFTGGSLADASGRGVALVKFGDPTLTTGHDGSVNGAYSFDGDGDYLQVVGDLGISAGDDFTISAWIKLDTIGNFSAIVSNYHDNGLKALMFRVNSNWGGHTNALDLAEGYSNNSVLNTGTWLHVVGVYINASRQVRFYVNGIDAGTGTTPYTIENQTTKFAIGGDYLNVSPRYFNGIIDEVRFYKYALTTAEVANLYDHDDIYDE
ncbi:MAG: hypothetical protein JXK07_06960 [Spirochaetes bacterium]|nr:hypothetical protein [Spirochaetota bacterium]MBN2771292.1 hypothetical protein [Spirochaetota bacterium]